MYPLLIKLGPLNIYSYGTLVAIGFLFAIFISRNRAKKYGINPDIITDLGLYVLISGLIGARMLYVITQIEIFRYRSFFDVFKIWEGGLVYYGGFIAASLVGIWYLKKIKYPVSKVADIVAPGIAIGQAFGRMGCFMNGCCYGIESKTCGIVFSSTGDNLPHIPTQLIESGIMFIVFGFLLKYDKRKKFDGETFLWYLILYGFFRFAIEMVRGDDRGYIFFGAISISQIISILIFIVALVILIKNRNAVKS